MNPPILKYALIAGVVYFCCMAIAHFFGIKQPLLFVYYDTPFFAYQDKIISFAVVAYAALFYTAANHRVAVPAALVVLAVTVLGLASINVSEDLLSVLKDGHDTIAYWAQTGFIALYLVFLLILYFRGSQKHA